MLSIYFPFLVSNWGSKFTSTFFKCCCGGNMEIANSFGVQVLCGINTFFSPSGVLFSESIFSGILRVTCNYSNYSPKIGLYVIQKLQIQYLIIFFHFKSKQITWFKLFLSQKGNLRISSFLPHLPFCVIQNWYTHTPTLSSFLATSAEVNHKHLAV